MVALTQRPVVLITGARAPVVLDLARSFDAAGHEVHLADCSTCFMARWSGGAAFHRYASPVRDATSFTDDIRALVERLSPALIVPACEEVFHLAGLARDWPALAGRLYAPPFETLRALHSKSLFVQVCEALGLRAPQTWTLDGAHLPADLPPAGELVLKPEFSRFGVEALIRPSRERMARLAPSPASRWIAQRHVAGDEVCFYAACRDGRVTAFSAYGSTWRSRGGASYAFEPVASQVAEALRAAAAILAEASVGDGQIACDAIVDAAGRVWLIECNPRATSGVHLFDRDGGLARAMTGQGGPIAAIDFSFRYLAPAYAIYGPGEGRPAAWLRGWRDGRDVIGAPGDRWPVLGALADGLAFSLNALRDGRALSAAMTDDIAWNGP